MYDLNSDQETPRQPVRRAARRSLISTLVAVPALVALVACSGGPPAQPNVPVASTQAAAGATLIASPAATAMAAASPAMGTAQAAASPAMATAAAMMGSPVASPSPSPAAGGPGSLRIADASLADATPWLSLQNDGDAPIEVGGWQLQVGEASAELPESAVVQPGSSLTLHAGAGMSSDDELYLGNAGDALAAAALPGAPVRLTDDDGQIISEVTVPRF
jgi:hypothetical protein